MNKGKRKSMPQTPGISLTTMMEAANMVVGNILSVSPDTLVSDPQVRKVFNGIDELAESLKIEGQQSPIIVSPADPATGKYTIQKGERRWRAAKKAGLKKVNITVTVKPQSLVDSIAGQMIENIQRLDLSPVETADALGVMHDQGLSYAEIASRLGKSKRWVQMYMNLYRAPDYVQALSIEDITQDMEIIGVLRSMSEIDEEECRAVCRQAREEGVITRQQVRAKLEELKSGGETEQEQEAAQPVPTETTSQPAITTQEQAVADDVQLDSADADYDVNPETGEAQAVMPFQAGTDEDSTSQESQAKAAPEPTDAPAPAAKPKPSKAATHDGLNATDQGAPEDWVDLTTADAMKIEVAVIVDGEQISGYLMTDRVCPAPSFAWVYLYDDGYSLCTHVTNIAITGIKQQ